MADVNLNITDRQAGDIREKAGQIMRNVTLINKGNTHTSIGRDRLDIINKAAAEIDEIMRNLK